MQLVVRTALPPDRLSPAVLAALRPIDPNLPLSEFTTLQDLVNKAVSPRRFLVLLLAGFAAFALILASLGIYAVISYSVKSAGAGNWNSDGAGCIRDGSPESRPSAYPGIGRPGAGAGNGSVASSDGRAGKLVVRCNPRRPDHIYRDRRAVDCGRCRRRVCPRSSSFANRSDGGIASELNPVAETLLNSARPSCVLPPSSA